MLIYQCPTEKSPDWGPDNEGSVSEFSLRYLFSLRMQLLYPVDILDCENSQMAVSARYSSKARLRSGWFVGWWKIILHVCPLRGFHMGIFG